MLDILQYDTFIQGLSHIATHLDTDIDPAYLFGRTGHGARFELAMNTRTGKLIGHPSGHYSFDIVGVTEQCFPDAGIDATVYVGPGYATRARTTAAQSERELPDNVILLDDYVFDPAEPVTGNLLYAHHSGEWRVASTSTEIDTDYGQMPFGPVVIDVHGMQQQSGLPASTFRYLIDTLERGEEPMEVRGRNGLSTVSGWKAFARWMQSFSVPLPNVQHRHLARVPNLLVERRQHLITFLEQLVADVDEKEANLLHELKERYSVVVERLLELIDTSATLDTVRAVYLAEQKTQKIYKQLDTHLTYHR